MSEWIRIRIKDFYKNAVGEEEYAYVSKEVYEALADTFRRGAHAEEMRNLRHTTADGYAEGETENLMTERGESLEDAVTRRMELLFFEGMTIREIAEKQECRGVSLCVPAILKRCRNFACHQ